MELESQLYNRLASMKMTSGELRRWTVTTLQSLRLFPNELCRMRIPLCRLVPMPMVRPTLASDILALEQQFVYGYEEGARVFYVSIADE